VLVPDISYLSSIHFKSGAASLLPQLLEQQGIAKPLVVTDRGLVALGLVEKLGLPRPVVFDEVFANPDEDSVLKGIDLFGENQCDGLVAFGGGSPMDCAKMIAVGSSHELPLEQYAFLNGGLPKITRDKPKVIAVPTTAGTGSEVGRAALITLRTKRKMAFLSPFLIPDAVICDPALTLGTPAALTAGAGLDAITHCLETYCSPKFNPPAEAIALDGLKRGCGNIRGAVRDGSDLEARSEMMMSALQGGMSFQKGLGIIHSLSHPLGALQDPRLHHGALNGIFLPHALRFNLNHCPTKMDAIAETLHVGGREELPAYFEGLMRDIAAPLTLKEMGMPLLDFSIYADHAKQDHCCLTNPREVTAADCLKIYQEAFDATKG
jgi:4-hydroxybutyrate dehydrogenase